MPPDDGRDVTLPQVLAGDRRGRTYVPVTLPVQRRARASQDTRQSKLFN